MDQKNRLLREAMQLLEQIALGHSRPLGYPTDMEVVLKLRDRIAKNLKIDYSNLR